MNSDPRTRTRTAGTANGNIVEMTFVCPPGSIETIAMRAAEIVLAQLGEARPAWLTLEEAATRYRSTSGALRKRAQRGQLPGAVRDGARWLVDTSALDAALRADGTIQTTRNGASAALTAPPPARRGATPHAK